MATIRKTITLSDTQDAWIKRQITQGGFTNDSEYIRDLVRRDQEGQAKLAGLREAIAVKKPFFFRCAIKICFRKL